MQGSRALQDDVCTIMHVGWSVEVDTYVNRQTDEKRDLPLFSKSLHIFWTPPTAFDGAHRSRGPYFPQYQTRTVARLPPPSNPSPIQGRTARLSRCQVSIRPLLAGTARPRFPHVLQRALRRAASPAIRLLFLRPGCIHIPQREVTPTTHGQDRTSTRQRNVTIRRGHSSVPAAKGPIVSERDRRGAVGRIFAKRGVWICSGPD